MSSAWRNWRTKLAFGLALASMAGDAAMAQFYFRPFAYSYRYELPPDDDDFDGPRYASRRSVARILSREGFQLVGPLGRRGDQIVATGVSRREGETRFFIDPFEGVILHAVSLGSPPPVERQARRDDDFIPQLGGSHPVVKEIGRDRASPQEDTRAPDRTRRAARPAPEEPAAEPVRPLRREAARPAPQLTEPTARPSSPAPIAAPASKAAPRTPVKPVETAKPAEPQNKPAELPKPIEWAKPAEIAKPAEAAKAVEPPKAAEPSKPAEASRVPEKPRPIAEKADAAKPVETAKTPATARLAEPKKPVDAKREPTAKAEPTAKTEPTAKPAPVTHAAKSPEAPAPAPAPRTTAARSTGGSHRAIVPPKASEGVTVVTPSTPATSTAHAPAGGKTPQSVAMPKE